MAEHRASQCAVCHQAQAMMSCPACGNLECCFVCLSKRHSYGQMRTHTFTMIPTTGAASSSSSSQVSPAATAAAASNTGNGANSGPSVKDPRLGDTCQWCEEEDSTIKCNLCVMVFCEDCANEFHESGGALFATHKKSWITSNNSNSATNSNTNNNNNNSNSTTSTTSVLVNSPSGGNTPAAAAAAIAASQQQTASSSSSASSLPGTTGMLSAKRRNKLERIDVDDSVPYTDSTPPDSPMYRLSTTLSPQASFQNLQFSGVSTQPNATFKLAAYGLGIADTKLAASNEHGKVSYFVAIDYQKEMVNVYGKVDKEYVVFNGRSFHSMKQVVGGGDGDMRHLSIYFNDTRPVAQLLAMNRDEGGQIRDLLQAVTRKERGGGGGLHNSNTLDSSNDLSAAASQLYSGPAFKKGKMSWGARWISLDRHKLHILKKKDAVVPTHSIDLSTRVVIEADKQKPKQFTITTNERKFIFKVYSQHERDTVVALLLKAADLESKRHRDSLGGREGALLELSKRMSLVMQPKFNAAAAAAAAESNNSKDGGGGGGGSLTTDADDNPLTPASMHSMVPSRNQMLQHYLHGLSPNSVFTPARPKNFDSLMDKLGSEQGNRAIEFLEERVSDAPCQKFSRVVTHGVYRLMGVLCDSMNNGARLSETIYVPKSVWYQQGAKFVAYPVKVECFEMLQQEMLHLTLASIDEDVVEFVQSLVSFRVCAEDVQNKLAHHLSCIHSVKAPVSREAVKNAVKTKSGASKLMSSIRKKVTRGVNVASKDKVGDTTKYVRLLASVMQSSEIFEKWISRVESDTRFDELWDSQTKRDIEQHLLAISEFFHGVVCNVVVRDMKKVIKRYLKHCSRSLLDSNEK